MTEIRNEFEQSLVNSGYRIFTHNYKNALRGFQKKMTDNKGIKYFITVFHYNHAEQLHRDNIPKNDSYTAESQFDFDEQTSNVSYWGANQTAENIESFFDKFWNAMSPSYYEEF